MRGAPQPEAAGEVEKTAATIAAGQLDRRVPESDPRTEVGRLSLALNGMLTKFSKRWRPRSRRRKRPQFGGPDAPVHYDASHELRTPLTTIRGFAELYRQGAARDVAMLLSRIESEASRMGLLVDDLLLLARLDVQRPLEHHRVDLLALASDAVHDGRRLTPNARSPWKSLTVRTRRCSVTSPDTPGAEQPRRECVAAHPDQRRRRHSVGTKATMQYSKWRTRVPDESGGCVARVRAVLSHRLIPGTASGGTGLGLSIVNSLVHATAVWSP